MAAHVCPITQHNWNCIGTCEGPKIDKCPSHCEETSDHVCLHENATIQEKIHERAPSFSCADCGYGT
jgi:hypothetical protein